MRTCKLEGHSFEPRYDIVLPGPACMPDEDLTDLTPELMTSLKETIYVQDVCTRCGYVVERKEKWR